MHLEPLGADAGQKRAPAGRSISAPQHLHLAAGPAAIGHSPELRAALLLLRRPVVGSVDRQPSHRLKGRTLKQLRGDRWRQGRGGALRAAWRCAGNDSIKARRPARGAPAHATTKLGEHACCRLCRLRYRRVDTTQSALTVHNRSAAQRLRLAFAMTLPLLI